MVRSLAVGGIATVVDGTCLSVGVKVFHLPRVLAGVLGVIVGTTLAFFLNKVFAFQDKRRSFPQMVRYLGIFLGELALWTGLNWLFLNPLNLPGLTERFANWVGIQKMLPYVDLRLLVPKFASDFIVFTCINLAMLRYVVFPMERHQQGTTQAEGEPAISPGLR